MFLPALLFLACGMVCEIPRQRNLLIHRRGTFFEDPFFRDAWDDYSNAVRRIVDRFNHGWVSPAERWRDTQYHSMYRTLRTARLNYTTHSAKFKEDGSVYKLVMDVREFIGGDITVRTAGGTVSVRGKMEIGSDGGCADDRGLSTAYGRTSTAKTLHRRFTLPADADTERVESSLSRDAVLTVTIPKRTDVHYIPVNLEDGGNKENESANGHHLSRSIRRVGGDTARQSGVKRPSDSPLEVRRKKSQEIESECNDGRGSRRSAEREMREIEGKRRRKEEEKENIRENSNERTRRRDSKYEDVYEINIPIRVGKSAESDRIFRPTSQGFEPEWENLDSETKNSSRDCSSERKLRITGASAPSQDRTTESISKHSEEENDFDLSAKLSKPGPSKSEQPIPIVPERTRPYSMIDLTETTNIGDRSTPSKSETKAGSPKREPSISSEAAKKRISLDENKIITLSNATQPTVRSDETEPSSSSDWRTQQLNKLNLLIKESAKNRDKAKAITINDSVNCVPSLAHPDSSLSKNIVRNTATTANSALEAKNAQLPGKGVSQPATEAANTDDWRGDKQTTTEKNIPLIKETTLVESENIKNIIVNQNDSLFAGRKDMENLDNTADLSSKHSLQTPKISNASDGGATPLTPGGRDVPIEKRQSLLEEDMFNSCWSDFSNTLQDVLSRLQELSSELGVIKTPLTTPTSEEAPSIPSASLLLHPKSEIPEPAISSGVDQSSLHKRPPLQAGSEISAHSGSDPKTNHVRGVGGREGGSKEDSETSHKQQRPGQDCSEACDLHTVRSLPEEIPQTALKRPLPSDSLSAGLLQEKDLNSSVPKRPHSLPLHSVTSASEDDSAAPSSENSAASLLPSSKLQTGSFLQELKKNCPVEVGLQQKFQRRCSPETAQRQEQLIDTSEVKQKVVPVGGLKEAGGRSLQSLSPSEHQLPGSPGQSRTCVEDVDHNCSPPSKYFLTSSGVRIESDTEAKSLLSDRGTESVLQRRKKCPLPPLNDLNSQYSQEIPEGVASGRSPSFALNIDASPESNVSDESESVPISADEGVVEGRFSFPISQVTDEKRLSHVTSKDVSTLKGADDIIVVDDDSTIRAKGGSEEILTDDVMGCERPLAPSARAPLKSAKGVPLRLSSHQKPREQHLLQEGRGDAKRGNEAHATMGGAFARGRKESPSSESLPGSPKRFSLSSSPSPSIRGVIQKPVEEKPLPPYVRQRHEPSKRYSGFAHINSDNVRRMRDVWGARQETRPPSGNKKIPPESPTRTSSSRRASELQGLSRTRLNSTESSCHSPLNSPSEKGTSSPFRKSSPSPTRSPASPSLGRLRFTYPENNRITSQSNQPTSAPTTYSSSSSRKGSEARGSSPAPLSPSSSRRNSQVTSNTSSRPSSVERKLKSDNERLTSDDYRQRSSMKSSRKFSPEESKPKNVPTSEFPSEATKVHHKIFKRLRNANLQPDSEAICFKEEEDKYKMVLDVEEYVPGEVEVLQDDRVLTVKGRVQTTEGGRHVTVKTFNRTFNIPKNSREEDIDSALSQDGILTIFVPKKRERVIKIELVD